MGHGIGAHQQLKGVEVSGGLGGEIGPHAGAFFLLHPVQAVLQGGQDIGAGAGAGVQGDDLVVHKGIVGVEALLQQLGHQAHLGLDHLHRGVVHSPVLAHFRVIGGQEVLVEIEPGVSLGLAGEGRGVHRADHPFQHRHRGLNFLPGLGVAEDAEGVGQQAMAGADGGRGLGDGEARSRAGEASQEQGVGERLGIGVGELEIVGVGEKVLAPIRGQKRKI